MRFVRLTTTAFISCLFALGLSAAQPELSSDQPIEFSEQTEQIWAKGDAVLRHEDLLLKADSIGFNRERQEVEAVGHVEFTRKDFRVIAERLTYNLQTRAITSAKFRLGKEGLYVKGDSFRTEDDAFVVDNTVVYYGAKGPFSMNAKSKQLRLKPDEDKVIMKHVRFRIGKLPIFYLPQYTQSFDESPIDLSSEYGSDNRIGPFLRNTFFLRKIRWKKNRSELRIGGLVDYNLRRGVFGGPAAKYKVHTDDTWLEGDCYLAGIRDHGDKDIYEPGDGHIPHGRYFLRWRHKQTIGQRTDVTGKVDWWSDSQVQRDYRPRFFKHNQEPDNFVEGVYCGDQYLLGAITRFRPNFFQYGVQERLPEVTFDYLPTELGKSGIYHNMRLGYTHYRRRTEGSALDRKSDRFDGAYMLKRPIPLTDWLTVVPIAGGRIIHFARAEETRPGDDFTRTYYQFGFDLEAHGYGQWGYSNEIWEIQNLRHTIRPVAKYRYIPQSKFGSGQVPPINEEELNPDLDPIDIDILRDIEDTQRIHLVRVGVENYLYTHKAYAYGARALASFYIYQDIRVSKKKDQGTFSDFFIKSSVYPVYWFDFSLYQRVDTETIKVREIYTSTKIKDGDIWTAELRTYAKRGSSIHQYSLGGHYYLTHRHSIKAHWYFDARIRRMTKQTYSFRVLMNPAWTAEVHLTAARRQKGKNELRFGAEFDWKGI